MRRHPVGAHTAELTTASPMRAKQRSGAGGRGQAAAAREPRAPARLVGADRVPAPRRLLGTGGAGGVAGLPAGHGGVEPAGVGPDRSTGRCALRIGVHGARRKESRWWLRWRRTTPVPAACYRGSCYSLQSGRAEQGAGLLHAVPALAAVTVKTAAGPWRPPARAARWGTPVRCRRGSAALAWACRGGGGRSCGASGCAWRPATTRRRGQRADAAHCGSDGQRQQKGVPAWCRARRAHLAGLDVEGDERVEGHDAPHHVLQVRGGRHVPLEELEAHVPAWHQVLRLRVALVACRRRQELHGGALQLQRRGLRAAAHTANDQHEPAAGSCHAGTAGRLLGGARLALAGW